MTSSPARTSPDEASPDGLTYVQKDMTWPSPWWTVAGTSGLGVITGVPRPARNRVTSSSRCSQAAAARTAVVLAATLATTGAGLRCTTTLAPSARTTGSLLWMPRRAATLTAASARVCVEVTLHYRGPQTAGVRSAGGFHLATQPVGELAPLLAHAHRDPADLVQPVLRDGVDELPPLVRLHRMPGHPAQEGPAALGVPDGGVAGQLGGHRRPGHPGGTARRDGGVEGPDRRAGHDRPLRGGTHRGGPHHGGTCRGGFRRDGSWAVGRGEFGLGRRSPPRRPGGDAA